MTTFLIMILVLGIEVGCSTNRASNLSSSVLSNPSGENEPRTSSSLENDNLTKEELLAVIADSGLLLTSDLTGGGDSAGLLKRIESMVNSSAEKSLEDSKLQLTTPRLPTPDRAVHSSPQAGGHTVNPSAIDPVPITRRDARATIPQAEDNPALIIFNDWDRSHSDQFVNLKSAGVTTPALVLSPESLGRVKQYAKTYDVKKNGSVAFVTEAGPNGSSADLIKEVLEMFQTGRRAQLEAITKKFTEYENNVPRTFEVTIFRERWLLRYGQKPVSASNLESLGLSPQKSGEQITYTNSGGAMPVLSLYYRNAYTGRPSKSASHNPELSDVRPPVFNTVSIFNKDGSTIELSQYRYTQGGQLTVQFTDSKGTIGFYEDIIMRGEIRNGVAYRVFLQRTPTANVIPEELLKTINEEGLVQVLGRAATVEGTP
jgi:hypothetical protein